MLVTALVFALGASIGSFTNVLILRLPASESVVRPGSRCPVCRRPLAWYENIPILSWIALGGRCRTCRTPISIQYPLVELAVGLVFAGNFLLHGPGVGAEGSAWVAALAGPEWIVGSVFSTLLLAIALTDVRTYLIPDELSVGGMVLGLLLSLLPGGLTPLASLLGALAGGALLLGVAWAGAVIFRKEAMGGGDIKMLAMVGAFTGWRGAFLTLFLGALLGSILYGPISLVHRFRARRAGRASDPTAGEQAPISLAGAAPREPAEERATGARAEVDASRPEADSGGTSLPDLAGEASGGPGEEIDRALVPFGFFLAPAAAIAFYAGEDLMQAYLRLVGLGS